MEDGDGRAALRRGQAVQQHRPTTILNPLFSILIFTIPFSCSICDGHRPPLQPSSIFYLRFFHLQSGSGKAALRRGQTVRQHRPTTIFHLPFSIFVFFISPGAKG